MALAMSLENQSSWGPSGWFGRLRRDGCETLELRQQNTKQDEGSSQKNATSEMLASKEP